MAKQEASPAVKKTRTQNQRCVISARPPTKAPEPFGPLHAEEGG
jgi:hypothetical protein